MDFKEAVKILKDDLTCGKSNGHLEECHRRCGLCKLAHPFEDFHKACKVVLPTLESLVETQYFKRTGEEMDLYEATKVIKNEVYCEEHYKECDTDIKCINCKHYNDVEVLLEAEEVALSALEELQQYKEVGTLEEVSEAMEKQRSQKVLRVNPVLNGENYECPNCGDSLTEDDVFAGYCKWCGQHIE